MTNELNRVHQAEARDRDSSTHQATGVSGTDSVEAGVEWIYVSLFSNASIWRERGGRRGCLWSSGRKARETTSVELLKSYNFFLCKKFDREFNALSFNEVKIGVVKYFW